MKIGIAADHQGFALKEHLGSALSWIGYDVVDFGAYALTPGDDYPNYVIPLAKAVASREVERGLAICGSGVGVSIAANKVHGVRAGLCHDHFSAHQGVEDDDMNLLCLGSGVVGAALAWELVQTFLAAKFNRLERHVRRLTEVRLIEQSQLEQAKAESKEDASM
jgi:ribose 5-phosphate isomerase B